MGRKGKEFIIGVYFDEKEVDILVARTNKTAEKMIKEVEEDGFDKYYSEEVKEDWFEKFELVPSKITAKVLTVNDVDWSKFQ